MELGLWNRDIRNHMIENNGSIQDIKEIPKKDKSTNHSMLCVRYCIAKSTRVRVSDTIEEDRSAKR